MLKELSYHFKTLPAPKNPFSAFTLEKMKEVQMLGDAQQFLYSYRENEGNGKEPFFVDYKETASRAYNGLDSQSAVICLKFPDGHSPITCVYDSDPLMAFDLTFKLHLKDKFPFTNDVKVNIQDIGMKSGGITEVELCFSIAERKFSSIAAGENERTAIIKALEEGYQFLTLSVQSATEQTPV